MCACFSRIEVLTSGKKMLWEQSKLNQNSLQTALDLRKLIFDYIPYFY